MDNKEFKLALKNAIDSHDEVIKIMRNQKYYQMLLDLDALSRDIRRMADSVQAAAIENDKAIEKVSTANRKVLEAFSQLD